MNKLIQENKRKVHIAGDFNFRSGFVGRDLSVGICRSGFVGRDLNLQKFNYKYLTISVAVVLVVR